MSDRTAVPGQRRVARRRPRGLRRSSRSPSTGRSRSTAAGALRDIDVAYETLGELDATASQRASWSATPSPATATRPARADPATRRPGWWDGLIGPGAAVDTDRYFVVCVNVLGGCQGTTGPASIDPATGRPYGSTLPRRHDPRHGPHAGRRGRPPRRSTAGCRCVGGSMGGMQVLEWGVMYPDRVRSLVAIATCARPPPSRSPGAAIGAAVDPRSIRAGAAATTTTPRPATGPTRGWPSPASWPRSPTAPTRCSTTGSAGSWLDPMDDRFTLWQRFDVEGYLDYHGAKLVRRFDANSLPRDQQGHGPPRRRPRPGRRRVRALAPGAGPDAGHQHQQRHALPALPAAAAPRRSSPRQGTPCQYQSRSTAPTATTGSCSRPDQVGRPARPRSSPRWRSDHDRR